MSGTVVSQPERPQPVRNAAMVTAWTGTVSAFISALLKALIAVGVLKWTLEQALIIMVVVDSGLLMLTATVALWKGGTAAEKVTPLENPHIAEGSPVNDGRSVVAPRPVNVGAVPTTPLSDAQSPALGGNP